MLRQVGELFVSVQFEVVSPVSATPWTNPTQFDFPLGEAHQPAKARRPDSQNIPTLTRKIYRQHTRLLAKLRRLKFTTKKTYEWQRTKSGHRRSIRKWMPPRPSGKTITSHPWLGGCVSTETTHEGNGWHVHAHLLIDCRFVSAGRLAKEWAKLVGQEFAIVKVMDVREREYLQEICKYVVEGSELAKWAPDLINEFVRAQRGLRMFNSFGTLREMAPEIRREINAQKPRSATCECGADDFLYQSEESALLDDVRNLERNKSRPRHSVRVHGVEVHAAAAGVGTPRLPL